MGALKQMTVSRCVVCRDGMEMEISTTQLVPGDIVKIEEGLNVPADLSAFQKLGSVKSTNQL